MFLVLKVHLRLERAKYVNNSSLDWLFHIVCLRRIRKDAIMRMRNVSIFSALIFVTSWVFLTGCAPNRVNLVDNGTVSIERIPSGGIYISKVRVNQEGNEFVVTGRVKRSDHSPLCSGHVYVAIMSPEGKILEQVSTYYSPRFIPRKRDHRRLHGSRFEVRLPFIPPAGSKIRVAYHRPVKSESETPSCGVNRALLDE